MKTFTESEVIATTIGSTVEHDNQGQIVLYTGIFAWQDGSFHDEPDPSLLEDEGNSESAIKGD